MLDFSELLAKTAHVVAGGLGRRALESSDLVDEGI
jgi:hypothetical protein